MAKTKLVNDYVDVVLEKFPFLTKSEINKILTHGMKMYSFANTMRADVLFLNNAKDNHYIIHTGRLGYDSYIHYFRWIYKWRMKERVMWRLTKLKWDGCYYIGLNDELHAKIVKLRKKKIFTKVFPTKILKELYHNKLITHIWQIPYPIDCGFKFFAEKLISLDAKYIGKNKFDKYHKCFKNK